MANIKVGQTFIKEFLERTIEQNKVSHAYLFEVNKDSNYMHDILHFVKKILCSSPEKCSDHQQCNICRRIDNNNYPEFKIIETNDNVIKKNQIIELQEEFSTKAVEGKYKVYLIKDCDKMNVSTANSLLKFLEEPEDNIIAILITTNKNKVLKTIISRCYNIKLTGNKQEFFSTTIENYARIISNSDKEFYDNVNNEKIIELLNKTIQFILFCEKNGIRTIAYEKDFFDLKKDNRKEIFNQLDLIIHFYYDVLNYKNGNKVKMYNSNIDSITKISNNKNCEDVLECLNKLISLRDKYNLNLNVNLVVDSIINAIGGEKNEVSWS